MLRRKPPQTFVCPLTDRVNQFLDLVEPSANDALLIVKGTKLEWNRPGHHGKEITSKVGNITYLGT